MLQQFLKPGDAVLYKPSTLFGWVIAVKTYHKISHIEIYAGNGQSVASRDGKGVNRYPLKENGLAMVLRPPEKFNFTKAIAWFNAVKGQKYDWLGILCFTLAVARGDRDRQFCSEFATNFYRAGDWEPFQPDERADHVAPFEFSLINEMKVIFKN